MSAVLVEDHSDAELALANRLTILEMAFRNVLADKINGTRHEVKTKPDSALVTYVMTRLINEATYAE